MTTIYLPSLSLFPFFPFFHMCPHLSLLFSNRDVSVPLVSGRTTGPFTARTEHYALPFFTLVQLPSDALYPDSQRVNFLQIGILLQFTSSSIIRASPQAPLRGGFSLLRSRSRLQLLFMSFLYPFSLSPPSLFPLSLCPSLFSVFC